MIIGIDASRLSESVQTGTERYSREVIQALIRLAPQHRFRLYTRGELASGLLAWPKREPGTEVEICPIRRRRLWTHAGLAREVAVRPPDALFIPAHVLPITFAARPQSRRVRAVVTVHDIGYRRFPSAHPWRQRVYLNWSTRFSARSAAVVIADSQATRHDVRHFYRVPLDRIRVAYPGAIPLTDISAATRQAALRRFDLNLDQPFALCVGTLQPRKNLRRLIRAWRQLPVMSPAPLLVLAGAPGWGGEDLQSEVAACGLTGAVRLLGYVTDEEKAALMGAARALAFPSLYEGFGFPVLEAQSAGVPVVCSNTSSLPEVAGDAAILVDPLNEQAIATALLQAMCDESVRSRLIESGQRNVTRFSWDECANEILGALTSALTCA